jgi:hypothetical protein
MKYDGSPHGSDPLYYIDEAVMYLGSTKFKTTKATLYRAVYEKTIPKRKLGNKLVFFKSDLDKYRKDNSSGFDD